MTNWQPNDLCADSDLVAYERTILSQFNSTDWQTRRQKAIDDWLFPRLERAGFNPQRLRTRFAADGAYGYTNSSATDLTAQLSQTTPDQLDLATLFATPASDVLYIGSKDPFRGLSVRMQDQVSNVAGTMTFALWADTWQAVVPATNALSISGKPFAKGGSVIWPLPENLVPRTLNAITQPLYWLKMQVSATPTAAKAGQISVIRRSRLIAPLTFRTLTLIMREAPVSQEGPWLDKATWYEAEAERAFSAAISQIGPEFDTDGDDIIKPPEDQQTSDSLTGGDFTFQRM